MEPARWNQIEALLQAALDLDPGARGAFLDAECRGDAALRRELDALLAREGDADILETPALARMTRSGERISHYRVGACIGAGGMGDVYEAYDENLDRTVAVKILSIPLDPDEVRQLEQEAVAASRLNHPNIITILEFVHDGDAPCIVTELVEGQTLRELLKQKLPARRAVDIAIQVAAALKAAHTAWIIHRDIKPENIMVRADGLVKVVDFGIAKVRGESEGDAVIAGTANYMSPEQRRGEPLDGRTDLYSLGLVLQEMLDGEVPRELQRVVRKMLQPDRNARYSSAVELLDDLEAIKRRMENRTTRRMVGVSIGAAVVALAVTAAAAVLSINETWDERVLRDGHSAAARQAAFSPDGRLLVSCGEDGNVIVWDFATRQRLKTWKTPAFTVAFSPDGRWLATGDVDGTIGIWDARRLQRVRLLRAHNDAVGALAFSRDSKFLASGAGKEPREAILWDTGRWEKLRTWRGAALPWGTFVFSPDDAQLLSTAGVTVWDSRNGTQLSKFNPPDSPAGADWAALSPDARSLAAIDTLGDVRFWQLDPRGDLVHRRLVAARHAHQDHGRSIVFSPDGRLVASAADDILLWDAATHEKVARFEHPAIVWSVAFSPDGRWLVSAHGDGAVLVWDVAERERVADLNEHSGSVRAVVFSPDGKHVASGSDDRTVTIWDASSGRKQAVLTDHPTRVASVGFSRGSGELVSGDQDGNAIVWDLGKRRPRLMLAPRDGEPNYVVALSPDGRLLASTHGIYAAADGRELAAFTGQFGMGHPYGVAFTPDSRRVVAVTDAGFALVVDVAGGVVTQRMRLPNTHLITVAIAGDGRWLVTGEDEGAVRLWSLDPLRPVAIVGRHAARVKSVAISPDGRTVASAGDDKMIALWDVRRRSLRMHVGTHASPIYSIGFSPDGGRLVSGEHDHSVRVYTRQRTLWGFRLTAQPAAF